MDSISLRMDKAMGDMSDSYDNVSLIFHPNKIAKSTFDILNEADFWAYMKDGYIYRNQDPDIQRSFEFLRDIIIQNSIQDDYKDYSLKKHLSGLDEQASAEIIAQIKKAHLDLKTCLDRYYEARRRKIKRENFFLILKLSLIVPIGYILILAYLTKSIKPSYWYYEFVRHIYSLGNFLLAGLGMVITVGGLLFGVLVYNSLERIYPKVKRFDSIWTRRLFVCLSFVIAFLAIIVVNSGIEATFGVDPLRVFGSSSRD